MLLVLGLDLPVTPPPPLTSFSISKTARRRPTSTRRRGSKEQRDFSPTRSSQKSNSNVASSLRRASETGRRFASPNRRGKATRTRVLRWKKQSHPAPPPEPAKIPATTSPESSKRRPSRKNRSQKATGESAARAINATPEPARARKASRKQIHLFRISQKSGGTSRRPYPCAMRLTLLSLSAIRI